ncbi:MAG: putative toxin-antitoxin system toxin component, PIN family [Rhodocyclaceae bacterium]|nr:putative toxin-antitoxin system toxin component, PIN family [Rhodocyclaceae bacterium]
MKVFLDTNVWVSAFAASGLCEDLLYRCMKEQTVLTSLLIREELSGVLTRKLRPSVETQEEIAALFLVAATVPDVSEPADDNDARLVAAAAAAGADLFVTGDTRVQDWKQSGAMRIVSPREAWLILFPPVPHH